MIEPSAAPEHAEHERAAEAERDHESMQYQRIGVGAAPAAEGPGNGRRDAATHGARRHHLHQHDDGEHQRNACERIRAELADEIGFDEAHCCLSHHHEHVGPRKPQKRRSDRRLEQRPRAAVYFIMHRRCLHGPAFHPPPRTLYKVTRLVSRASCVTIRLCCADVELALRVEQTQRTVDADTIARLGQVVDPLRGRDERLLRRELVIDRAAARERVGHFAKRDLDRPLVVGEEDVAVGLGDPEPGPVPAGGEDRLDDLRQERPGPAAAAEQARQAVARGAAEGREADRREERRARGADTRVCADQPAFGREDIGPLAAARMTACRPADRSGP